MPVDLSAQPVEDVTDAELRAEGIASPEVSPEASASPFVPLQQPIFRAICFATLVSNFGGLIQAVAASWLMTTIATSPDMVALVQASTTLPGMIFSLSAGATSDNYAHLLRKIRAHT